MHEVFEHTADLGLRIQSPTIPALFAEAGQALFELVIENFNDIQAVSQHSVHLSQAQLDLLLFDWLNELLYLFETKRFVGDRFDVNYHDGTLDATVQGEPWDESRHHLDHEVKAITYHRLKVEQQTDGTWLAEVIVDI
jgi:SHS2 domain-containing protein